MLVAAELLKQSHKRAANASADGPSEGSKKLQTSDIRIKAKVRYLDNGSVSVETHHGIVFYEIKVLVFMLVHLFSFPERKAGKMCWGTGWTLDPSQSTEHNRVVIIQLMDTAQQGAVSTTIFHMGSLSQFETSTKSIDRSVLSRIFVSQRQEE